MAREDEAYDRFVGRLTDEIHLRSTQALLGTGDPRAFIATAAKARAFATRLERVTEESALKVKERQQPLLVAKQFEFAAVALERMAAERGRAVKAARGHRALPHRPPPPARPIGVDAYERLTLSQMFDGPLLSDAERRAQEATTDAVLDQERRDGEAERAAEVERRLASLRVADAVEPVWRKPWWRK